MYKFFSQKKIDNYFLLDPELQKHLKVIRIKNEDFLINYQNEFYLCNYLYPNKAIIKKKLAINNELGYQLVVAIPFIKQSHFEIALQKCSELGVTKIIPFISQYTDKSNLELIKKYQRFKKIIFEASQQAFRNQIPSLEAPLSFEEVIKLDFKNKFIAYEKKKENALCQTNKDTLLIVGPEGGFSQDEINLALNHQVNVVGLTKTILRTETALIYMLAKII